MMQNISKKTCYILLFAFAFVWFFKIGHVRLLEPDEGRYAEIPREMLANSDYVTPRLNNLLYFEKPPLQYWVTAAAYKVFGVNEWAARLCTSLSGAATGVALVVFGILMGQPLLGALSGALLLSSPFFVIMGHVMTLDMTLTLFLTLLMLSCSYLVQSPLTKKEKFWANLCFWIAAALGFLTKGLLVLVVPGLAVCVYVALRRRVAFFKNLNYMWGPLLFLLISLPWLLTVMSRNPDFFQFFIIHEHFDRFLKPGHDRPGPIWYFLPIIFGGFLPTISLLLNSKYKHIFQPKSKTEEAAFFFVVWAVSFLVFFSVSRSKLAPYILPIFPALAWIAAIALIQFKDKGPKLLNMGFGLFGLIGAVASVVLYRSESKYTPAIEFQGFGISAGILSVALFVALIACHYLLKKKSNSLKAISICLIGLIYIKGLFLSFDHLSPSKSGYETAQAIKPYLNKSTPIYSVSHYVQSVPFYLQRPVTLVHYLGELEFGYNHLKDSDKVDMDLFLKKWNSEVGSIAIISKRDYQESLQNKIHGLKIFEDRRRIVFLSQPPNAIHDQTEKTK